MRHVLLQAGLTIPDYIGADNKRRLIRHASEFWDHYGIAAHHGQQRPGDLLFVSRNGRFPTHIGIVRDEATYIHSPGIDGSHVAIAPLVHEAIPLPSPDSPVLYRTNPIGFKVLTVALETDDYRYHQRPAGLYESSAKTS